MPQTTLYDRTGKAVGSVELSDELFAAPVNTAVLHQVVIAQLAGRRTGTADTKTRGEVRGGGRKPYRQKGTGRARQGTVTAPHYRGGGVVFGPHPRSYEQRLPRKMKRLALRGALTAKFGDERDQGHRHVRARGHQDQGTRRRPAAPCTRPAGSSSSPRRATRSSSCRRGTCRPSRSSWPTRSTSSTCSRQTSCSSSSPPSRGCRRCTREALTAPEIILRPVISEKSIDESQRGKYTFAVHDKANKIQIKAAVEELYKKENVTVVSVNVLTTQPKEKRRGRSVADHGDTPGARPS